MARMVCIAPGPVQEFTEYIFNNPAPVESEDCLYLNVYSPSTPAPAGGRPVTYWIYGGSLQFGNSGQKFYDGSAFASYEDVVVVTVNYRTNGIAEPTQATTCAGNS
jgi:carboxylesterase type B